MIKVSKKRSILKSISWRIIGTALTSFLFWMFTGNAINILVKFGIIDTIIKLTVYYYHERVWNKCTWGIDKEDKDAER